MVSLANVISQIHCKEYQNCEGRSVSNSLRLKSMNKVWACNLFWHSTSVNFQPYTFKPRVTRGNSILNNKLSTITHLMHKNNHILWISYM